MRRCFANLHQPGKRQAQTATIYIRLALTRHVYRAFQENVCRDYFERTIMSTLEKFSLKSLAAMDGERIGLAFEQALKRVVMDCEDRPGESKERTVSLTLAVKPRQDASGFCDDCNVQILVSDSVPKRKSKVYNMSVRKVGHLVFKMIRWTTPSKRLWILTTRNSDPCLPLYRREAAMLAADAKTRCR